MCDPITIGSAALAAGGTAMNASAASRARASNQAAIDRQTDLSRDEFNERTRLSRENFDRDFTRSTGEYDKRVATEDGTTQRIRDVTRQGQQEQSQAEIDDIARSTDVILQAITGRRGATNRAFDERAAARQAGEDLRSAESARQRGFQALADSAVDSGTIDLGTASAEAGRETSRAQRVADVGSTVSGVSAPGINVSDLGKAAIEAAQSARVTRAKDNATAGARVASYGDLLDAGKQRLAGLNSDLGMLDTKAKLSLRPLETELGVAGLRGHQAGERADDTIAGISENAEAGLRDSAQVKRGIVIPSAYRQQALSDSIAQLGDRLIGSSIDYETGSGAASDRYMSTVGSSSANFENAMRGLTDYRTRNTSSASMLGGLLQQLAGYGFNMSTNPTTNWSKVGGWISRPFTSANSGIAP